MTGDVTGVALGQSVAVILQSHKGGVVRLARSGPIVK